MAPADDGTDPRHHLDDAQWITTYATYAIARTIGVYGRDETADTSPRSGTPTSSPTSPSRPADTAATGQTPKAQVRATDPALAVPLRHRPHRVAVLGAPGDGDHAAAVVALAHAPLDRPGMGDAVAYRPSSCT
ncbi:hypothetical protein OG373_39410 [Streptomyces avidinii]|uniref:hypothetical protein n=1 Tax=Streptomyces avidinii TaxID=1895 RepID=UPI003866BEDD|nr:hypothetical protein OG373_39410 [Streptomyces avidinii]